MMVSALLAVLSGLSFAGSSVAAKKGMKDGATPEQVTFLAMIVSAVFFGLLMLVPTFAPPPAAVAAEPLSVLHFALAGLLAGWLGRVVNFQALRVVGPARLNQIIPIDSLFTVVLAFLFAGERLDTWTLLGIAVVTTGVVLLTGEPAPPAQIKGYLLALFCAFLYGLRNLFIRLGVTLTPFPAWGAAVGNWVSLAAYLLYLAITGRWQEALPRPGAGLGGAVLCAGAYCSAWLCFFSAALYLEISVVSAFKNTLPIWAVGLSWLCFREGERVGPRLVFSSLIVTAGALMLLL